MLYEKKISMCAMGRVNYRPSKTWTYSELSRKALIFVLELTKKLLFSTNLTKRHAILSVANKIFGKFILSSGALPDQTLHLTLKCDVLKIKAKFYGIYLN